MIGIVIAAHGEFADGIKSAITLISGTQKNLETVALREGDSIEGYKERLHAKILEVNDGNGVIVFSDLFGASPANAAANFAGGDVIVITGMNLPMILEILAVRNSAAIGDLAKIAISAGRDAIMDLNSILFKNN
jgi:PTS system mannose-specific IIA component